MVKYNLVFTIIHNNFRLSQLYRLIHHFSCFWCSICWLTLSIPPSQLQGIPDLILNTALEHSENDETLATVTLEAIAMFLDTEDELIRTTETVLKVRRVLGIHHTQRHVQVLGCVLMQLFVRQPPGVPNLSVSLQWSAQILGYALFSIDMTVSLS